MIDFEAFRPSPVLEIDICDSRFDQSVAEVNEHLSQFGASYFFDHADKFSRFNSMRFATIGGGKDRSQEAAILMPTPFGNGVYPHLLARGEAIAHMAAEAGLRDQSGNLVPVLVVAAPSINSNFDLNKPECAQVASGNFQPIVEKHLKLLGGVGYGAMAGFVGYSQPAAFATIAAAAKPNFDVGNVLMGDPPLDTERGVVGLGRAFRQEGSDFKAEVAAEGIEVIDEIFGTGKESPDFIPGVIKQRRESLALARGFTHASLMRDLIVLATNKIPTVLLHATNSRIARAEAMRTAYSVAVACSGAVGVEGVLHRVEVSNTNHSFGDRVGRFATIAAAALTI